MSKASGRVGARAGKAAKFGGEGGGGGGAGGAGAGKAGAGKAGSSAGGATARSILRRQVETYQKLGIKRVTLDPDSDIKFVLPEKKTASTMSTRKLKRELG